jgi:hypothetical protein
VRELWGKSGPLWDVCCVGRAGVVAGEETVKGDLLFLRGGERWL